MDVRKKDALTGETYWVRNSLRDLGYRDHSMLRSIRGSDYHLATNAANTAIIADKNLIIGAGAAGVDYNMTINGENSDFVLTHLEDEAVAQVNEVIRGATSLWWAVTHFDVSAFNPGASGATHVDPGANTLGGFQINAVTETLAFHGHAHHNWDGASDPILNIFFEVNIDNTAGNEADTVDLKTQFFYKAEGEITNKTQTVEVATIVGQSARYKLFCAEFVFDYDLGNNVLNVGDIISMLFNIETDSSEVDDVVVTHAEFRFKTNQIQEEV